MVVERPGHESTNGTVGAGHPALRPARRSGVDDEPTGAGEHLAVGSYGPMRPRRAVSTAFTVALLTAPLLTAARPTGPVAWIGPLDTGSRPCTARASTPTRAV
jgi:hypothetical protein